MASNSQGAGDPMDVDSQGTGVPMGVDALGTGLPTNVDPLDNPQPLPSPVIKVPRLPAGPDAVLKDMRRRMSSKVTWFVQGLSLKSRYYARQPSERIPYPDGADSDPLDVLVLLKDIGNVSREELVQQITEQVNQTREYSRDTEWETGTYRRLQANPLAADFLRDVDTLIEELRRMEAEMRMNDQTAAVTRLFSTICETLGWDPKSIRDTGLQHELMGAVSLTWSARLRWMKGIVNKKHLVEEGVKPEELEVYDRQQNTMNNLVEHVNRRLHGPALRPDVRAIEYMCNWAASLVARDRDGWESHPRLTPEYARFLFEHSYEIPYATAVVLISTEFYAQDIEIIDSWMEYRSRYEWFRPTNHIFTEHIHNSMYRPWLVKLIAEARPVEQMDDEFRRRYTTEVLAERNKFVDYMDKNATPVWSSFGRWSRYEAPPQGADLRFTEAAVSEKRWTKAWYCKQHRPWHMCISCGWNYTCAVCANPHACPNCKNPFECAWTGCSNRSYNPEDNNTFYTYSIGATDLAPGRDKDGLRHTPIRIYMKGLNEPKTGRYVPNGGWPTLDMRRTNFFAPYYNTEFPPGQGPGAEITSQSLRDELELDGPRVPGAPGAPGAGAPRAGAPRPDAPYGPFGAARRPSGAPGTAGAAGGVAARPPGVLGPFGAAGPAGAAGSAGDNWRSRGGNTGGREGGGNNRSDRGDWRTGNWRTGGQGGGGGGDGASATVALAVSSFGSDSESEESAYNGSPSWGPAGRPSWYSPVMRQGLGGRDEVNWRDAADALQDDIAEQMRAEDKLAGTKRRRAGDLEAMLSALDSARKRRR